MLTVLLGLSGALVYGFADFLGGLASRRLRAVTVTAVAAAVGIVPLLLGLVVVGGEFTGTAVLWGAVAGASGGVAVLLLYRALAIGPMSVLSPLTAVFAAVVPVLVAVFRGTALSGLAVAALVVAVVAVVLVAAVRDTSGARVTVGGLVTAAVAGCGFGGIVLAYDMTPSDSGVAPLVVARVLQAVLLGTAAVVSGPVARSGGTADPATEAVLAGSAAPPGPSGRRPVRLLVTVVACGVLDALANVFVQAGLHSSEDPATLPVMSVLNALYPIGTVVLAGVVLRERLTAVQWTGIALALAASVGLALA
ncbi:drug/metabolite transporter (DMT)-like permease [Curtobacterium pusillum]|uniref:Drug/metabolite transporter (DMT)-like permease n=1 Tax=Curtobacterium pusillum TaxID=69373 RepID=A0AAW3T4I2_9MICO|nr:EamA/RhaT family transporter [Curtobacterium pusillum]MBA8989851.1 drug/metabolite transporter (DMT)-like permease [Curtobacterium pusillum]